ncbi:hypothetical protein CY0110_15602 [Crocosphaera chwakensis CCY0110]|uniref:Uncharacterized protein n=1 Tax=Crocosphaera chwakensis CCY0110 TaxID=391612 RepID=A3IHF2_9CHRO|nr:hypothetical protein CY0110_15602 [Crocosphaera chwakensis CCY0110]
MSPLAGITSVENEVRVLMSKGIERINFHALVSNFHIVNPRLKTSPPNFGDLHIAVVLAVRAGHFRQGNNAVGNSDQFAIARSHFWGIRQ